MKANCPAEKLGHILLGIFIGPAIKDQWFSQEPGWGGGHGGCRQYSEWGAEYVSALPIITPQIGYSEIACCSENIQGLTHNLRHIARATLYKGNRPFMFSEPLSSKSLEKSNLKCLEHLQSPPFCTQCVSCVNLQLLMALT